jgi:hypothetical protein
MTGAYRFQRTPGASTARLARPSFRLIAGQAAALRPAPHSIQCEPGRRNSGNGNRHGFRILEHIDTKLRKVGRNYVTQCPSCAA